MTLIFPHFVNFFIFITDNEIVIQSAGNLATTQSVIARIKAGVVFGGSDSILELGSVYEVAEQQVGKIVREVLKRDKSELIDVTQLTSSFLVGECIKGQAALYNVYTEGNFIMSGPDTPYFQIGEIKYGKPILDRIVRYDSVLSDALKCAMISFDSTIKSNLSVGLPIDILVIDFKKQRTYSRRLDSSDPYMMSVRQSWGSLIKEIFNRIPDLELEDLEPEDLKEEAKLKNKRKS